MTVELAQFWFVLVAGVAATCAVITFLTGTTVDLTIASGLLVVCGALALGIEAFQRRSH